jgi:pheromone shutdown protein TraB
LPVAAGAIDFNLRYKLAHALSPRISQSFIRSAALSIASISGLDLAVAGVQFQKIALETDDARLKKIFAGAGTKLTVAGLSRLQ